MVKKAILTVIVLCSLLSSGLMVVGDLVPYGRSGWEATRRHNSRTISPSTMVFKVPGPRRPRPLPAPDMAFSVQGPPEPHGSWPEERLAPLGLRPLEPGPGDIVIRGIVVWEGQVRVVSSNIIIENQSSLTLVNTTLIFNCSSPCQYQLRVKAGGTLCVLNGSLLTAGDQDNAFYFVVEAGAKLRMSSSEVRYCGYYWTYPGLTIFAQDAIITDCIFHHNFIGIYCYNHSAVVLRSCVLTDNQAGGLFCFSSNATLEDCVLSHNTVHGTWAYIASNVVLEDCVLEANGGDGVNCFRPETFEARDCRFAWNGQFGIELFGTRNPCVIVGCILLVECSDVLVEGINASRTDIGVFAYSTHDLTIRDCLLTGNLWGIYAYYSDIEVQNCLLNSNSWSATYAYRSSMALHACSAVGCGSFLYAKESTVRARDCSFEGGGSGFHLDGCLSANLTGCVIRSVGSSGIICTDTWLIARDCTVNDTVWYGAYCRGSTIEFHNCSFWWAGANGVSLEDCPDALLLNCSIVWSHWSGISCASSNLTLSGCTIAFNCYYDGLHAAFSNVNISWCSIHDNNGSGLFFSTGCRAEVHYCDIYGNAGCGAWNYLNESYVNATYNWWASPDGPEVLGIKDLPDRYSPEEVCEAVLYEPWLTEPVLTPDTEPPILSVAWPSPGWASGQVIISVNATDGGVGMEKVELYVDGSLACTDYEPPYELTWDTTAYPDGNHTLEVVAYDRFLNHAGEETTIGTDNTPPSIGEPTADPPRPGENEDVRISVVVEDELSGLSGVWLYYKAGGSGWTKIPMALEGGAWEAIIPGQPIGTKVEFKIMAKDMAGNRAETKAYSYVVLGFLTPMAQTPLLALGGAAATLVVLLLLKRHRKGYRP
ncbi:hypothetical protein B6U66_03315 [Candidatus Bathyarchaeota archaeon ex4484_135]|nr:MAG: hypothetical protein B6U66_03315 [Candidatus Bathyarchaeota archaeon ex4484_135]